MLSSLLLIATLPLAVLASPVKRDLPTFVYEGDAPFSIKPQTAVDALHCPLGPPSASSPPVLLVHGTMASGNDTWLLTYVPALKLNEGMTACYLELPYRAGVDMQVSAEYIAYALHYMSYLAGGTKTAVISHSQGGPDTQWALEWWPSTREVTSMYLPLVPDLLGVTYASLEFNTLCPAYQCPPSIWQQMVGSRFTQALRAHDFKALVPSTLTWTLDDEIVTPPNLNALLSGGTTIGIQEICAQPPRVVDHVYIITDAVAYSIVTDALRHGGTADVARILANDPNLCANLAPPAGMTVTAVPAATYFTNGLIDGFLLGADRVPSEPALMPYVYGDNATT